MSASSKRVALKGSNLSLPSRETPIGDVNPDEQMEVTVVLHPSTQLAKDMDEMNKISINNRKYLTHDEFKKNMALHKVIWKILPVKMILK